MLLIWRTVRKDRRLDMPSFVGAMAFMVLGTAAIFWFTRSPPASPEHLVAVLPCDFSGDENQAYRADSVGPGRWTSAVK